MNEKLARVNSWLTVNGFNNKFTLTMLALLTYFETNILTTQIAYADVDSTVGSQLLSGVAGLAAAVGAIIMIIVLVKNIKDYATGSGTGVGKIAVNAVVILVLISFIVLLGNGSIVGAFEGVAETAVNKVDEAAGDVLG